MADTADPEQCVNRMSTNEAMNLLIYFADAASPPPAWLNETHRELKRRYIDRRPPLTQDALDAWPNGRLLASLTALAIT